MKMSFEAAQERCRICLEEKTESHVPLYKKVPIGEDKILISEILEYCVNIKLLYDDGKPQNLCSACIENAEVAYSFKLMYIQSETTLNREILNKMINQHDPLEFMKKNDIIEIKDEKIRNIKDEEQNPNNVGVDGEEGSNDCFDNNDDAEQEENNDEWEKSNYGDVGNMKKTNKKIYNCPQCGKNFDRKWHMQKHYSSHNKKCLYCDFKGEGAQVALHLKKMHDDRKSLKCPKCNKSFFNEKDLRIHLRSKKHVNEEQKKGIVYTENDDVVKKAAKIKEKKHSCPQCDKSFHYQLKMLKHLRSHDKSDKKCHYCDFKGRGVRLGLHMEKNHEDRKTIQCPDCDRRFFIQKNLKRHMITHTGVKDYVCDVCGMCFIEKSNLNVHLRIHTGEKPYKCDTCGSAFTHHSALRAHEDVHSNEPKYTCELCGKVFMRNDGLRRHMSMHRDVRPHPCSLCGKIFRTKKSWNRHMNIHTGEHMFKCDVCSKEFNTKSNLRTHMRMHTGEKPHVCEVCGKAFTQAHCLRSHKTSFHLNT